MRLRLQEHRSKAEATFLRQAVALATQNGLAGQRPFGALVVHDAHVLATGVNLASTIDDPTAHTEVDAIRNAGSDPLLMGATLVTSCEPCALCHAAAVTAGIVQVVYAAPKGSAMEILDGPAHPQGDLLTAMRGRAPGTHAGSGRPHPHRKRPRAVRALHVPAVAAMIQPRRERAQLRAGATPAHSPRLDRARRADGILARDGVSDHVAGAVGRLAAPRLPFGRPGCKLFDIRVGGRPMDATPPGR